AAQPGRHRIPREPPGAALAGPADAGGGADLPALSRARLLARARARGRRRRDRVADRRALGALVPPRCAGGCARAAGDDAPAEGARARCERAAAGGPGAVGDGARARVVARYAGGRGRAGHLGARPRPPQGGRGVRGTTLRRRGAVAFGELPKLAGPARRTTAVRLVLGLALAATLAL